MGEFVINNINFNSNYQKKGGIGGMFY